MSTNWLIKRINLLYRKSAVGRGIRPARNFRASRGFTLMELLVVMLILVAIGAFAVPLYLNHLSNARVKAASIQIDRLGGILDLYKLDVGLYPPEGDGLQALLAPPVGVDRWNGPYLKKKASLTDPWGADYIYRFPGEHGAYDLFSLGADGVEGGEGENADATNW